MPKLGDLGNSVAILRQMRNQLVKKEQTEQQQMVEDERWDSFRKASSKIAYACESRNLEELVSAARELKNRLRRPSVRKELARLEGSDEDSDDSDMKEKIPATKDKNPTGACKCAQCGQIIDGSREPCVEGALCTRCALKNKVISKNKQQKKKVVVPPTGGMGGGGAGGGGGGEQGSGGGEETSGSGGKEKKESHEKLRYRSYLR